MTFRNHQPWTGEEIMAMHRMRREGRKPNEIAMALGRTEYAIHRMLSLEKKKGVMHKRLRHGRLKWDNTIINEWRVLINSGMRYREISAIYKVHPGLISQKLAKQIYGEIIDA